jgi:hypothetical protein
MATVITVMPVRSGERRKLRTTSRLKLTEPPGTPCGGSRIPCPLNEFVDREISYEIYLTHCFVVLTAVHVYRRAGWSVDAAYPLLAGTLAASWTLAALVERNFTTPSRWVITGRYHARAAGGDARAIRDGR